MRGYWGGLGQRLEDLIGATGSKGLCKRLGNVEYCFAGAIEGRFGGWEGDGIG